MNKQQEHIDRSIQRAKEWFAQHEASSPNGEAYPSLSPYVIDWRRPGTGNYAMRFIIDRNSVIVTGDVGDAIYSFGSALSLELVEKYSGDWHYFTGKCVASETGRRYTMKVPGISGEVINCRAIGHCIGLQMAIKQMQSIK